jgi:DNA ligase-1
MLFADVVATSEAVASTRSRTAKIDALATLLARSTSDEIATIVGFLVGQPRQGRIGIGWATLAAVRDSVATSGNGDPLTVADVDTAISALQTTTGKGSVGARRDALAAVFGRASEAEADFVVRLFTGELRQGALAGLMYDAIAKAAAVPAPLVRRAAMFSGDLGETARVAISGQAAALEQIGLVVLRPVLPMLAASAPNVEEALRQTGLASVEWKLDGARIQVHRLDNEVRIYTRNLNDITERLPEVVRVARTFPSEAFVLDGEAIGVDDDAKPHVFQDTMSRFGRDDASSHAMTISAFFFDVLHVDGEDVLDWPLRERAQVLERIVGSLRVPAIETDDPAVAAAFLDEALTTGHEGVMVKALDSPYDAGRRGGSWRKVKPVRTLDLVVLAAEWGHGRRRGWLSNLHLGARDPESGDFVMVGKTFKGLTDELLTWQTARLQEIAEREEGITVYVRPELVVEIALDGVQASTRYAGGVALRFARVRAYRPDKSPADADTIQSVRELLGR